MSTGLIDVLAPAAGGLLGAGLGELAGSAFDIAPTLAEAIGGGLGGLGGALLTKGGATADILGALGGAIGGPAVLQGAENLFGGTLSNALFGGTGAGYGASAVPSFSLGGSAAPASPGGFTPGGGGASAVGAAGGGDVGGNIALPDGTILSAANGGTSGSLGVQPLSEQVLTSGTETGGGLGSWLSSNKNWLLPAAGVAAAALKGNQQTPAEKQLAALAAQQGNLASKYSSALETGKLPPGANAAVQSALQAAEANVRSTFAGMGLSGSTMEAEALNSARQQAAAQTYDILNSVTQTGLQAAGLAGNVDSQLMQEQLAQDQALQQAIASWAAAFGGGGQMPGYPGYTPYGYGYPGMA